VDAGRRLVTSKRENVGDARVKIKTGVAKSGYYNKVTLQPVLKSETCQAKLIIKFNPDRGWWLHCYVHHSATRCRHEAGNYEGKTSILHSIPRDGPIWKTVSELLFKGVSDKKIVEAVLLQHSQLISKQAIDAVSNNSVTEEIKNISSSDFTTSLNALIDFVNSSKDFELIVKTHEQQKGKRTIRYAVLLDRLSLKEFSLAPEMLTVDYSANTTSSNYPCFFIAFVAPDSAHIPLAIAWTDGENAEVQEEVMNIVAGLLPEETLKRTRQLLTDFDSAMASLAKNNNKPFPKWPAADHRLCHNHMKENIKKKSTTYDYSNSEKKLRPLGLWFYDFFELFLNRWQIALKDIDVEVEWQWFKKQLMCITTAGGHDGDAHHHYEDGPNDLKLLWGNETTVLTLFGADWNVDALVDRVKSFIEYFENTWLPVLYKWKGFHLFGKRTTSGLEGLIGAAKASMQKTRAGKRAKKKSIGKAAVDFMRYCSLRRLDRLAAYKQRSQRVSTPLVSDYSNMLQSKTALDINQCKKILTAAEQLLVPYAMKEFVQQLLLSFHYEAEALGHNNFQTWFVDKEGNRKAGTIVKIKSDDKENTPTFNCPCDHSREFMIVCCRHILAIKLRLLALPNTLAPNIVIRELLTQSDIAPRWKRQYFDDFFKRSLEAMHDFDKIDHIFGSFIHSLAADAFELKGDDENPGGLDFGVEGGFTFDQGEDVQRNWEDISKRPGAGLSRKDQLAVANKTTYVALRQSVDHLLPLLAQSESWANRFHKMLKDFSEEFFDTLRENNEIIPGAGKNSNVVPRRIQNNGSRLVGVLAKQTRNKGRPMKKLTKKGGGASGRK
jgi:hypothetical protein